VARRIGKRTLALESRPGIVSWAAVVGGKEGAGPLKKGFDEVSVDSYFGQESWEKAETTMLTRCVDRCLEKADGLRPDCILGGDLLNQCVSSAFTVKDRNTPYFGLYGACSTMAEGLGLAAVLLDGGGFSAAMAFTGSHFCAAERQYRFPLEYGGQRTPSSQWTVTGAGAVLLGREGGELCVTHMTPGRVVDAGITDANNMGAAMAPAALDTITAHFDDTGRDFSDYDAVFTGDLGAVGHDILQDLLQREGLSPGVQYLDCGVLIYDLVTQDVHAGGSGCGCSASVLAAHILPAMERGVWRRVLFAGTGALMSPLTCQQGCSIPGVCHAVTIEREDFV
jgi:stage V sporulation protein AD